MEKLDVRPVLFVHTDMCTGLASGSSSPLTADPGLPGVGQRRRWPTRTTREVGAETRAAHMISTLSATEAPLWPPKVDSAPP